MRQLERQKSEVIYLRLHNHYMASWHVGELVTIGLDCSLNLHTTVSWQCRSLLLDEWRNGSIEGVSDLCGVSELMTGEARVFLSTTLSYRSNLSSKRHTVLAAEDIIALE